MKILLLTVKQYDERRDVTLILEQNLVTFQHFTIVKDQSNQVTISTLENQCYTFSLLLLL